MLKFQAVRGTKDILPADAADFQALEAHARAVVRPVRLRRDSHANVRNARAFHALAVKRRTWCRKRCMCLKTGADEPWPCGRKAQRAWCGLSSSIIYPNRPHFASCFTSVRCFGRNALRQAGFEEFWQIGGEYFGNAAPAADAELLILVSQLFTGSITERCASK